MKPPDAASWLAVFEHGMRAALDAAERSTGVEHALNLAMAKRMAGLILLQRLKLARAK